MKSSRLPKLSFFLIMPVLAAFIVSCSPSGKIADYPQIYSLQHKKPGLRSARVIPRMHFNAAGAEAEGRQSSRNEKPESTGSGASCEKARLPVPAGPDAAGTPAEVPGTNPANFTASLSGEPDAVSAVVPVILPRTENRVVISAPPAVPDTGLIRPSPNTETRESHPETFAIVSLVSSIVFVLGLILNFPALALLMPISAIVFGVLGLKSSRHKMALAGMVLGIIELSLLIVAAIALIIFLSSFHFLFIV